MAARKITLSEGLGWLKILKARQTELIGLRNQNSQRTVYLYATEKPQQKQEPTYDAVKLDKRVTLLAREIRLCESAIKQANAQLVLDNYQADDDVLGELEV